MTGPGHHLLDGVVRLLAAEVPLPLALLAAAAVPLARSLAEPALAPALVLFALDLPVFALAQGHAALPTFLAAVSPRLLALDVVVLKAVGAATEQAGR
jgi:hypothetical protein